MAILSKEQILAAEDLPRQEVEVPEWGGSVIVRTMTGNQRDSFEKSTLERKPSGELELVLQDMRAKLLVRVVVDENDEPLFTEADYKELGQKSAKVLDRLFDVASKLNGISAADVEELAKNSAGVQSDDSGSD